MNFTPQQRIDLLNNNGWSKNDVCQLIRDCEELETKLSNLVEAQVSTTERTQGRIKEAEYWRDQIFSPEHQASKPTISLTDFIFRIEELKTGKI